MADNLQPLPGHDDAGDIGRLRNIDPSLLVTQTEDDGWRCFEASSFWVPPEPDLKPVTVDQALVLGLFTFDEMCLHLVFCASGPR